MADFKRAIQTLRSHGFERFSLSTHDGETYYEEGGVLKLKGISKKTYDAIRFDIERLGHSIKVAGTDGYGRLRVEIR